MGTSHQETKFGHSLCLHLEYENIKKKVLRLTVALFSQRENFAIHPCNFVLVVTLQFHHLRTSGLNAIFRCAELQDGLTLPK